MPDDLFYSELYFTYTLEEGTSNFFRTFIYNNDIIFDIGANIGFMSLQFASIASNGMIFSFEPMPSTYKKLTRNISENHFLSNRIKSIRKAVSDKAGTLNLYLPNDKHHGLVSFSSEVSNDNTVTIVDTCCIDDFIKENNIVKVDLMKIDVEGAEALVIKGAMKSIFLFKPSIMIEANIGIRRDLNDLYSILESINSIGGYKMFRAPNAYKKVVEMKSVSDFGNGDNIFFLNEKHQQRLIFNDNFNSNL
jgi:FkbM family methyltransferase